MFEYVILQKQVLEKTMSNFHSTEANLHLVMFTCLSNYFYKDAKSTISCYISEKKEFCWQSNRTCESSIRRHFNGAKNSVKSVMDLARSFVIFTSAWFWHLLVSKEFHVGNSLLTKMVCFWPNGLCYSREGE